VAVTYSGLRPTASSPELDNVNAKDEVANEAARGIVEIEAFLSESALVSA